VLRWAAGHDLLRRQRPLPVVALDDHLAALGEHVGQDAAIRHRDRLGAVLAGEIERELVGVRIPAHRPGAHPALHAQVLAGVRRLVRGELVHLEVVGRGAPDAGVHEVRDGRGDDRGTYDEAALVEHRGNGLIGTLDGVPVPCKTADGRTHAAIHATLDGGRRITYLPALPWRFIPRRSTRPPGRPGAVPSRLRAWPP